MAAQRNLKGDEDPTSDERRDPVYTYFVEKGDLFRILMESPAVKRRGTMVARGIAYQLSELGIKSGKVLDVGCGTGRISIELAKQGYEVVGIDISPKYIELAKAKASESGVEGKVKFILCDARLIEQCIKERGSFDAVIFVWSSIIGYYSEEDDVKILSATRRLTKEGGLLIIADSIGKEYLTFRQSLVGTIEEFIDCGDHVVVEKVLYNPIRGEVLIRQRFYRKQGLDLIYIADSHFRMRVYSLEELVSLAERCGWCLGKVLRGPSLSEAGFSMFDTINVLFRAC